MALAGITKSPELIAQKVTYTTDRPQVFIEEVLSIYEDSDRRDATIKKLYCVKSHAWKHEDEYRLVARDRASYSDLCFLSIPEGDFYKVDDIRLKAIYFGQHCNDDDRWRLTGLANSNADKSQRPELYKLSQGSDTYELSANEVGYDRFASLFSAPGPKVALPSGSLANLFAGTETPAAE